MEKRTRLTVRDVKFTLERHSPSLYCPNQKQQYTKKATKTRWINSTNIFTAADIQWRGTAQMCEDPLSFWQTTIQIQRPEYNHFACLNILHVHISDLGRKKVTYHVLNFTFLKQVGGKAETQLMFPAPVYGKTNVRITSFMFLRQGRRVLQFTFTHKPFYTFLLFTLQVERLTHNDCVPPKCVGR